MRALTDYAFREFGLYRVGLTGWAFNARTIRAYRSAAFIEEGAAVASASTTGPGMGWF
jgi:RimJ/RimL family protein N-acetyltransferase